MFKERFLISNDYVYASLKADPILFENDFDHFDYYCPFVYSLS